jgi:hypothetical protein
MKWGKYTLILNVFDTPRLAGMQPMSVDMAGDP